MSKILAYTRLVILSLFLVIFVVLMVPIHWIFNLSLTSRFRIRTAFCRFCFFVLGFRLKLEGNPVFNQGPYLIVCNHRSLLDPFICARYCHAFFLGKAEISKYPVFGYGSNLTGAIFVERESKESRGATRKAIAEAFKSGYNVLLYPEGTTNGQETTKQFYKGSFEVAHEEGVPVIPVVLEYRNKDHYWVDGGVMAKSLEQFENWTIDLHMWIGEPIPPSEPMSVLENAQSQMDRKILEVHDTWSKA